MYGKALTCCKSFGGHCPPYYSLLVARCWYLFRGYYITAHSLRSLEVRKNKLNSPQRHREHRVYIFFYPIGRRRLNKRNYPFGSWNYNTLLHCFARLWTLAPRAWDLFVCRHSPDKQKITFSSPWPPCLCGETKNSNAIIFELSPLCSALFAMRKHSSAPWLTWKNY